MTAHPSVHHHTHSAKPLAPSSSSPCSDIPMDMDMDSNSHSNNPPSSSAAHTPSTSTSSSSSSSSSADYPPSHPHSHPANTSSFHHDNTMLNEQDEDVKMAAEALDGLRHFNRSRESSFGNASAHPIGGLVGAPYTSHPYDQSHSHPATSSEHLHDSTHNNQQQNFFSRLPFQNLQANLQSLPIVQSSLNNLSSGLTTARNLYQEGKSRSSIVRYGGEFVVEPVLRKVVGGDQKKDGAEGSDGNSNQDGMQVDSETNQTSTSSSQQPTTQPQYFPPPHPRQSSPQLRKRNTKPRSKSASNSKGKSKELVVAETDERQSKRVKSRWQTIVSSATSAAGAGAAVVSEESMKSLRYCLEWLQYATAQIDHQISLLRAYLSSFSSTTSTSKALTPHVNLPNLAQIKREIVETLRKAIDVVARYAGNFLNDQGREVVRRVVLGLPGKWASLNSNNNAQQTQTPTPPTPSSPVTTHPNAQTNSQAGPSTAQPGQQQQPESEAQKILHFANESTQMLKSIQNVFQSSVSTAETWLERLSFLPLRSHSSSTSNPESSGTTPTANGHTNGPFLHEQTPPPPSPSVSMTSNFQNMSLHPPHSHTQQEQVPGGFGYAHPHPHSHPHAHQNGIGSVNGYNGDYNPTNGTRKRRNEGDHENRGTRSYSQSSHTYMEMESPASGLAENASTNGNSKGSGKSNGRGKGLSVDVLLNGDESAGGDSDDGEVIQN